MNYQPDFEELKRRNRNKDKKLEFLTLESSEGEPCRAEVQTSEESPGQLVLASLETVTRLIP